MSAVHPDPTVTARQRRDSRRAQDAEDDDPELETV